MKNPWLSWAMLAAESQQVIMLRMMKLAKGDAAAQREWHLMVSEKLIAAAETGAALAMGGSPAGVTAKLRRKVRANRRRLSK